MQEYDSNDLKSTLMYIKKKYGVDVLLNSKFIFAYLCDLAPNLSKERKMIQRLSALGIIEDFSQTHISDKASQKRVKVKWSMNLTEEEYIRSDIVEQYLDILMEVFGWKTEFVLLNNNSNVNKLNAQSSPVEVKPVRSLPNNINSVEKKSVSQPKAVSYISSDFEVKEILGGVEIVRYIGNGIVVNIPDFINGKAVVSIGEKAFYNKNLKSIKFPFSLKNIGYCAFSGCSSLEIIIVPLCLKAKINITTLSISRLGLTSPNLKIYYRNSSVNDLTVKNSTVKVNCEDLMSDISCNDDFVKLILENRDNDTQSYNEICRCANYFSNISNYLKTVNGEKSNIDNLNWFIPDPNDTLSGTRVFMSDYYNMYDHRFDFHKLGNKSYSEYLGLEQYMQLINAINYEYKDEMICVDKVLCLYFQDNVKSEELKLETFYKLCLLTYALFFGSSMDGKDKQYDFEKIKSLINSFDEELYNRKYNIILFHFLFITFNTLGFYQLAEDKICKSMKQILFWQETLLKKYNIIDKIEWLKSNCEGSNKERVYKETCDILIYRDKRIKNSDYRIAVKQLYKLLKIKEL